MVVRAWFVQDYKKKKLPFSMELVLMDRKGDRIGAFIRRTLILNKEQLQEGMVFTISSFDFACNSDLKSIILKTLQAQDVPNKGKYKVQDA
ncbi:DUF223 domain protein [Medicago truncatula]|uniref:DUF223 domain protein n=1 Tax=Medicago truncatula TaxID=3880 RepID=A0A072UL35_MEDTR|nr:DUF223 domain protein [Medicago truncatula]